VLLSLVLIVPFLLLVAAGIVMIGGETTRFTRAKAAAYPIGLAFLGAIGALILVTSQGPITVRFYDPASVTSFIIPIGFYVDRLSAVMMTLITGVSTIIYCYSTSYMYQDRHARRYLALICLTDFVLICMVSSGNLMMLFLFWQLLSYLLYLLAHNHVHPGTLAGAFKTFTLLRVADMAFPDEQARQIFDRVLDVGCVDLLRNLVAGDAGAARWRVFDRRQGWLGGDEDVRVAREWHGGLARAGEPGAHQEGCGQQP